MSIEPNQADFLAARVKTATVILNATGWQQGVVNAEFVGVDSVFFYVYDFQTRWIWCCSIPRDTFYAALKQSGKIDESTVIVCCEQMIAECASGNGLNPGKENQLAISFANYIAITKTYQLSERATKANHFVVIRYGSTDTLRPFVMGGPAKHFNPFETIRDAMRKVIEMDGQNHPEWIATS